METGLLVLYKEINRLTFENRNLNQLSAWICDPRICKSLHDQAVTTVVWRHWTFSPLIPFPSTSKKQPKQQVGAKYAPAFILLCKILTKNLYIIKQKLLYEIMKK